MKMEESKEILSADIENLNELFEAAENLLKGNDLDVIDDLTETELEQLSNIKTNILKKCISMVKKFETIDFLQEFKNKWSGENFWKMLEERLKERTKLYLISSDIRKMTQDEKENLLDNTFHYYFFERETTDFVSDKMKLDKCIICTAFRIIEQGEFIYVFGHYSKRRFINNMIENTGLHEKEVENLWDLFSKNHDRVERFAMADKVDQLNRAVSRLNRRIEDMDTDIDVNYQLLFELYDKFAEKDLEE